MSPRKNKRNQPRATQQQHTHTQNYDLEYRSFARYIRGEPIAFGDLLVLIGKSLFALVEMAIRYVPGGLGYVLRAKFYGLFLKHLGNNVLIDTGVQLFGLKNISISDYVWIDTGVRLEAMLGEISIGKRAHIAPYAIIAAREPVVIEDYAAVGAGAKIYANSERPFGGKRMSGPMIPEEFKAYHSKKIVLGKDSCIGTGSVLLPGAMIGEGAVVGANAVVTKPVAAYNIVVGAPARTIGKRAKVTVPEL
jgi:acetyltransferase-like isoleucine patch superfamily enzyme